MEREQFENSRYSRNTASSYMYDDYLSEYIPPFQFARQGKPQTLLPKSFSERYPNMSFGGIPFEVNEEERAIIAELDRLAAEAKELLSKSTLDKAAFAAVALQVAKLCHRDDWVEDITNAFRE